jgi:hypothetical protein
MLFPNKLYKKGIAARGVIVKRSHGTYRDIRFGYYQVTTRLQLPDDSTTERTDMLTANDDGEFNEGDMIPVRYDPNDHSKFVIDFPLIEAREKERQAQLQAARRSPARITSSDWPSWLT